MIQVPANRVQPLSASVLPRMACRKIALGLYGFAVAFVLFFPVSEASAQQTYDPGWEHLTMGGAGVSESKQPSPGRAFARSLVVPGWGHYYSGGDHGRIGRWFLASEAILVVSVFSLSRHAAVLDQNARTLARAYAGVDVSRHGRAFELAVGNHPSRAVYDDVLERSRSWDLLDRFPQEPSYNWEWRSEEDRVAYRDMRSRRDHLRQQLPALGALMVANRLVSAIGAYNRARSGRLAGVQSTLEPVFLSPESHRAVQLRLRFDL